MAKKPVRYRNKMDFEEKATLAIVGGACLGSALYMLAIIGLLVAVAWAIVKVVSHYF